MIDLLNAAAQRWYAWQIAMLWQVAILIAIIWGIDRLIRKWAWPQVRYALWMLVLVKLLIPPTWTSPVSVTAHIPAATQKAVSVQFHPGPVSQNAAYQPQMAEQDEAETGLEGVTSYPADKKAVDTNNSIPPVRREDGNRAETTKTSNSLSSSTDGADGMASLSWTVYAIAVWLTGIAGLSVWLILRFKSLRDEQFSGDPQRCFNDQFKVQFEQVASKLKLQRKPDVILTNKISSPAVFGILRPVLVMPARELRKMDNRDIEHILLHELAHIKRGDLLVHAVYMLLQIVYWFNPLLWLIRRTLQNLRELCCDATVARLLRSDTVHYRQTLLETARRLVAEPVDPGLGLLGLFENSNWLLTRLQWLEKKTWKNRRLRIATVIGLVTVMSACVLPMANRLPESYGRQVDDHRIELVAVKNLNSDTDWWKPNGQLYPGQIRVEDSSGYTSPYPGYALVFNTDIDPENLRLEVKGAVQQSGLSVDSPKGLIAKRCHIKSRKKTTVRVGVLLDDWQTVGTHTGDGNASAEVNGKRVIFSPAQGTGNECFITVSDELMYDIGKRMIAVDKQGTVYTGQQVGGLGIDDIQQNTWRFEGVRRDHIKEFQFQVQPYTWVTFKNVALQPDEERLKLQGIDEQLEISDKTGDLTIHRLSMDPPDGKSENLRIHVTNTAQQPVFLGLEYYADSGTIAGVYSPGATGQTEVRQIAADWKGTVAFPIRHKRFTKNGSIHLILAKCSDVKTEQFLPPVAEVLFDKTYPVFSEEGDFAVTGTVTDTETGAPIAGAEVYDDGYNNGRYRTTTDESGRFTLHTANEEHNVAAKADGYQPQKKTLTTFPFANNDNFNFQLTRNVESETDKQVEAINRLLEQWFADCRADRSVQASALWHPIDSDGDIYQETRQVLGMEPDWAFTGVSEVLFFEDNGLPKAVALSGGFEAADEAFGEKSAIAWDLVRPGDGAWKIEQSSFIKLAKWEFSYRDAYLEMHPQTQVWKADTETDAESDLQPVTHNSELETNNYVTVLPHGVTVELLGVADIPADSTQWWAADGEPIPSVYWEGTTGTNEGTKDARQVVLRIESDETNPDVKPSLKTSVRRHSVAAGPGSYVGAFFVEQDGQTLEDHAGCSFSLHDDYPTVDIPITVAYGPWRILADRDAAEQGNLNSILTDAGTLIFNEPVEKDGKTTLSATLIGGQLDTWRCVAIDAQGRQHPGGSAFASGTTRETATGQVEHHLFRVEFRMPLSKIIKFEFQTRQSQKVTFKNVALNPGGNTDVVVEINDGHSKDDEQTESQRSGPIQWREVAATLSTLRTALRVWGAKNPTAAGSWTQDELTLDMLEFVPKDITGDSFSAENFTWQVFRNAPYEELTYKITATADNRWMTINQDHRYTSGKLLEPSPDKNIGDPSSLRHGGETDAEIAAPFSVSTPETDQTTATQDALHTVLTQQREILREMLDRRQQQYEAGVLGLDAVNETRIKLLQVEARLADSREQRIAVLEQVVDLYRQQEQLVRQRVEDGRGAASDLNAVKFQRLEAEQAVAEAAASTAKKDEANAETLSGPQPLMPGDEVQVSVYELLKQGEFAVMTRQVSETGTLSLYGLDEPVRAQGLTVEELRKAIIQQYGKDLLKDPFVEIVRRPKAGQPNRQQPDDPLMQKVQRVSFKKDMRLTDALDMMSQMYKVNIVPSQETMNPRSVIGVTNLYDVTLEDILKTLCGTTHKYVIDDNFIYVYTNDEYNALPQKSDSEAESRSKPSGNTPLDLVPAVLSLHQNPDNRACCLVVSIPNDSNAVLPQHHLRYYRGDPAEDMDETGNPHSGYHQAGPIEPGQTWNERTGDFFLPDGDYTFTVVLDYNNAIPETDESNNRATLQVTLRDGQIVQGSAGDRQTVFCVYGRVTDPDGKPMSGVTVRAACGMGTLLPTGQTVSADDGTYRLMFGPGVHRVTDTGRFDVGFQAAAIYAEKDGYYEQTLCRHANLAMAASKQLSEEHPSRDGFTGVVLPDQPYELNFVMAPASFGQGRVTDPSGNPVAGFKMILTGQDLYPSTSVLKNIVTDEDGRFCIDSIPARMYRLEHPTPDGPALGAWITYDPPAVYTYEIVYDAAENRLKDDITSVYGLHADTL